MKTGAVFLLCLAILCDSTWAWKHFWKGRRDGGNVGEPSDWGLSDRALPAEQWFDQTLDPYNNMVHGTWKQRYFVNSDYFKPDGPVFLMIGGEGEASAKWMVQGAWIKYAAELHALCFQLEHRYYGKSHPTEDTGQLMLASELALADLGVFITAMNKQYNLTEENKWIAFGGSYPGSLAAWLRLKFPHLVHGAVSSSGPLLAKVDFYEYYDVVTNSLALNSDTCVEAVQNSFNEMDTLLKHIIGQKDLTEKFKLCYPLEKSADNPLDVANLFENLASIFAEVVQYSKDNRESSKITIDQVCDIMTNTVLGPPINRLAEVNKLILTTNKEDCLDYKYDKMINDLKETSWDSKSVKGGARQWTFQTCNEFGFYQTSENRTSIFGNRFSADFFIKQCSDIFASKFTEESLSRSVEHTNIMYGGLDIQTTNVIYVHGSIDPWHALGLTSSHDHSMPTIYIEGTAHCANMYEPSEKDVPQLVEARKKILDFLKDILKKH